MKELSIEQKAKRYDEAIAHAKNLLKTIGNATLGNLVLKNEFKNMFPALEEDEDEEIREWIKKELVSKHVVDNIVNDVMADKALAWLEKRVPIDEEKILIDARKDEDERIRKNCIHFLELQKQHHAATFEIEECIDWLEKKGEQKPADKIQLGKKYKCIASPRYSAFVKGEIYKPEDKFLCSLMNFCYDCFEPIEDGEKKSADKAESNLLTVERAKEMSPFMRSGFENEYAAWSEEDEEIARALNDYVKNLDILFSKINIGGKDVLSKEFREKVQDWLKSIKDRVQPQPKQEWGEEDKKMINKICQNLYDYPRIKSPFDDESFNEAQKEVQFIKSLRPQNNITDEELAQAKKDAYNDALDKIEYHSGEPTFDDGWHAAIDCILKNSIIPHTTWKPTEAQLTQLGAAVSKGRARYFNNDVLRELYEQLKQL